MKTWLMIINLTDDSVFTVTFTSLTFISFQRYSPHLDSAASISLGVSSQTSSKISHLIQNSYPSLSSLQQTNISLYSGWLSPLLICDDLNWSGCREFDTLHTYWQTVFAKITKILQHNFATIHYYTLHQPLVLLLIKKNVISVTDTITCLLVL